MSRFLSSLALLCTFALGQAVPPPGTHRRTMQVDGVNRVYQIHIPPSYDPAVPVPLVLGLHSANHRGFHMDGPDKGISRKADDEGFVAVYPSSGKKVGGQGYAWNWQEDPRMLDDIKFLTTLIDRLENQLAIDPARIYVLGISSGGYMTQRLGSALADRIAAIAPVSATLGFWPGGGNGIVEIPPPSQPLPILLMNGKRDQLIPYNGNQYVISVPETVAFWAAENGCDPTPHSVYRPGYDATLELYTGGGAAVGLCTFHTRGHAWQIQDDDPRYNGSNIDLIWRFFEAYGQP